MRGHGCRFFESKPSLGPHEAAELATLSRWIAERHPNSPVRLFGFSLGALSTIHALSSPDDDPFFTAAAVRYLELAAAALPCIKVLPTESGGHLGHLSMYPEWSARTMVRFFSQAYRLQCSAGPTLLPA